MLPSDANKSYSDKDPRQSRAEEPHLAQFGIKNSQGKPSVLKRRKYFTNNVKPQIQHSGLGFSPNESSSEGRLR